MKCLKIGEPASPGRKKEPKDAHSRLLCGHGHLHPSAAVTGEHTHTRQVRQKLQPQCLTTHGAGMRSIAAGCRPK